MSTKEQAARPARQRLPLSHTWRGPNYLNHRDASEQLTLRIMSYWRERGHDVRARVESVPLGKGDPIQVVQSDLINGLPRGAKLLAMEAA
jgi:hypothetical protein